ncbi:MAG: hypothetical protein JSR58_03045 [Verrucomicrobia bacterium]|nr:hypothetical protein [Verrucomicrobiota bacterium]
MKKPPLYFSFLLALIMTLVSTAIFPSLKLMTFAPFFALSFYRVSFPKALWIAFGCGLLLDLLSSELRFGLQALACTVISSIFYTQKRHFFEDKPLAFSAFSALISLALTIFLLFLTYLPFQVGTLLTNLIFMPVLDGLYAFLWFTCPLKLYTYIQKTGWKNLFKRADEEQ